MIQRCLEGIVIDQSARVARCYFRSVPLVGGSTGKIIERIENAKGIPESPISLCTVAVPGTGLEGSAKSLDDAVNSRWILKEMPLH